MDLQKRVADALLTLTKARAWLDAVKIAAAHGQSNLQIRAQALAAVANAEVELRQAEAALAAQFVNNEYAAGRATVQQVAASAATQAEPLVATPAMQRIRDRVRLGEFSDFPGKTQTLGVQQLAELPQSRLEFIRREVQQHRITDWPAEPNRQQMSRKGMDDQSNAA